MSWLGEGGCEANFWFYFQGSLDLLTVPLDSRMYMYLISILLLVFTDSQTYQKQNLYTVEEEICIENFNLLFLLAV